MNVHIIKATTLLGTLLREEHVWNCRLIPVLLNINVDRIICARVQAHEMIQDACKEFDAKSCKPTLSTSIIILLPV